jgi:hypothetical protein
MTSPSAACLKIIYARSLLLGFDALSCATLFKSARAVEENLL